LTAWDALRRVETTARNPSRWREGLPWCGVVRLIGFSDDAQNLPWPQVSRTDAGGFGYSALCLVSLWCFSVTADSLPSDSLATDYWPLFTCHCPSLHATRPTPHPDRTNHKERPRERGSPGRFRKRGSLEFNEDANILGRKLPPVRTEQGCHLPNIIGDGWQLPDGRRIVADPYDERPFSSGLAPRPGRFRGRWLGRRVGNGR